MTHAAPALKIVDGQPRVSSLQIAKHFNKRHGDVLRKIEALDSPEKFNERNFAPVKYTDSHGEKRPAIEMTRDGFTLLAMGFTGKKAMAWKVAYIEAFNAMEAELQGELPNALTGKRSKKQQQLPIPVLNFSAADKPITKKQFAKLNCGINILVNLRSMNDQPITQQELSGSLARHFGLQDLQDLTQPKFDEAREKILRKIAKESGLRFPESKSKRSTERQARCEFASGEILQIGHEALNKIRNRADQALDFGYDSCRVADRRDSHALNHKRQVQCATELFMYSTSLIARSVELAGEAEALLD